MIPATIFPTLAAPTSMLAAGVQGELVPIEDLPDEFFEPTRATDGAPRYTARLFFRRRPEDYQRSVQLLAAGMDLTEVARLMRVHHRTIAAVRDAEGARLDTYKQKVMSNLRIAVEVLSGDLADDVRDLATREKPMTFAILVDKLAMLEESAGAGVSVAEVRQHLTHDAVMAALAGLPAIGSPPGAGPQKEGGILGTQDAAGAAADGSTGQGSDSQSEI